ncbi:DUF2087 domain-containing protein [Planococcus sp. NCCP-2050]|uniref:DUF2087 domain-containing protein n=1 Tax=Planococcus sp. NCCP-2050 TaxID=2944679 RepID=UPI002041AB54|nr:DUF2087 domain-containing protein [Planococcus sp. NCCP-2050]GKW44580.1 hypothetical protein NCCP2050_02720 [Planococcus sp. NCCP-2050]
MNQNNEISAEEKEKVLTNYFKGDFTNRIEVFPSKEKKKLILLEFIAAQFEPNRKYSENEMNEILKKVYHDYVSIRRYLIEYGFLDRNKDGSSYWLKE